MGVILMVGCTKIDEQAAIQAAAAAGLRSVDQLIVQLSHHTDAPIDCREITDYTVAKFKKMISILDRTGHARFRRGPAAPPPPPLFSAKPPSPVARGGAIPNMPPAPLRCHCPKRRKNVAKRTMRVPAVSWKTAASSPRPPRRRHGPLARSTPDPRPFSPWSAALLHAGAAISGRRRGGAAAYWGSVRGAGDMQRGGVHWLVGQPVKEGAEEGLAGSLVGWPERRGRGGTRRKEGAEKEDTKNSGAEEEAQ